MLVFRGFEEPKFRNLKNKQVDLRLTIDTEEHSRLSVSFLCFYGRVMHRYEFLLQTDPPISDKRRDEIRDELCLDLLHPIDPDFTGASLLEYGDYSDHPVGMVGFNSDPGHHWSIDEIPDPEKWCTLDIAIAKLEFLLDLAMKELDKEKPQSGRGR